MNYVKGAIAVLLIGIAAGLGYTFFTLGGVHEKAVVAVATAKVQAQANTQTRADLGRATVVGKAREHHRRSIDSVFQQLESEAHHAPSAAVDSYVLPDDRLRIWREANAGSLNPGAATGQPDSGTAALATTGLGPHPGSGDQPPGGGEGIPPAGLPDLPSAGVPAIQGRGL